MRLSTLIKDPARLFVVLATVFGLLFVFLFPPYQVIDEPSHFYRSYQIAEGHIVGQKVDGLSGGYLPTSLGESVSHYTYLIFNFSDKAHLGTIRKDLGTHPNNNRRSFIAFNNTVVYPPVTYLPQSIGIRISMLFKASPIVSLYFARIASLTFWIILFYWSIRMLPFGKWAALVIGLFPMTLSQAASVSADATINSLSCLAIASILYAIFTPKITKKLLMLITATGIALGLTKIPYLLVLLLAIAIPKDKFPARFSKVKFLLMLYGLVLVLVLVWNYLALGLHTELRPPETSSVGQAHFILRHPLVLIKAFLLYPFTIQMDATSMSVYGILGWNEIRLPLWLIGYGYFSLFISLMDVELKKFRIALRTRLISLLIALSIVISVIILLYITWMPVGFRYIYDIWGRYFTPLLLLSIPVFGGVLYLDKQSWQRAKLLIAASLPLVLAIITLFVWNRYYGHLRLGFKDMAWLNR